MIGDLITELILTIHGVESRGEWQLQVTPEFGGIDGLVHDPHMYGKFAFWKVLAGPLRTHEIDKFYRKVSDFQVKHPHIKPSVVAHSFGTYIVTRALMTYPSIALNRLVLCGSIVERDYDWRTLISERRVLKVRNEVAGSDRVVRLFRMRIMRSLVPHTGPSGIDSFETDLTEVEQQTFQQYRHSSHFIANSHCRLYWLPFLRGTVEFRDLCRACADESNPTRDEAYVEFSTLHDPAVKAAIRHAFGRRNVNEAQLADYFKLVRHDIIHQGATGTRKFDELVERITRALLKHVG